MIIVSNIIKAIEHHMNLWIFLALPVAAKLIRNYLIRRRIIT